MHRLRHKKCHCKATECWKGASKDRHPRLDSSLSLSKVFPRLSHPLSSRPPFGSPTDVCTRGRVTWPTIGLQQLHTAVGFGKHWTRGLQILRRSPDGGWSLQICSLAGGQLSTVRSGRSGGQQSVCLFIQSVTFSPRTYRHICPALAYADLQVVGLISLFWSHCFPMGSGKYLPWNVCRYAIIHAVFCDVNQWFSRCENVMVDDKICHWILSLFSLYLPKRNCRPKLRLFWYSENPPDTLEINQLSGL